MNDSNCEESIPGTRIGMIKNSVNKLLLHKLGSNESVLLKISLELSLGQIMYQFTIKNSICAIQTVYSQYYQYIDLWQYRMHLENCCCIQQMIVQTIITVSLNLSHITNIIIVELTSTSHKLQLSLRGKDKGEDLGSLSVFVFQIY